MASFRYARAVAEQVKAVEGEIRSSNRQASVSAFYGASWRDERTRFTKFQRTLPSSIASPAFSLPLLMTQKARIRHFFEGRSVTPIASSSSCPGEIAFARRPLSMTMAQL